MNTIERFIIEKTKELSQQKELYKYVNLNLDELDFIKNTIGFTISEKEFLLDIMNYISVGTNVITNKNNQILTQLEIAELLNINARSLQRKFNSLIEKKIIYTFKDWNKSYYIINPYLCHRGFCIEQIYSLFDENGYKKEINDKSVKVNNKSFVITKEKVLETLLSSDLTQIENGLTLVKTQYEVNDGFIDILAKDQQGVTTIIEIKIKKDDPKLVEQCVYYPTQFKEKTRVISIAPNYSNKLYNTLDSLGYVEMKSYTIENNRLIINDFIF